MRIAFFGLAYHARTGSSRFLLDLLARQGSVETIFAEADPADLLRRAAGFDEARYDAIVVFQLHEAFALLSGRHPNVSFVPMYDAMFRGGAFRWRHGFSRAKVLCFSWALRQEVMRRGARHHLVQYYPEARPPAPATRDPALHGFFWYRHGAIPPARIYALTAGSRLADLALHDAPDPGHPMPPGPPPPPHLGRLLRSTWSADGSAFAARLAAANLFFAPRPLEGIGMSFLEAMAAGLCVVAPDAPTMNEYISHGRNGLLYALDREAPLDLREARALGAAGRESVLRGRARWEAGVPAMLDFLLTPAAALDRRGIAGAWPMDALPAAPEVAAAVGLAGPGEPLPETAWIRFRAPGEETRMPADLAQRLAAQPASVGVVLGHHLRAQPDGGEALVRPAEPGAAWARLLDGEIGPEGPRGMPAPGATLIRRDLLLRLGAVPPASDAALLDLLLRARAAGADSIEAECILSRRAARDPTAIAGEDAAWQALLRAREGEAAARRYTATLAAARAAAVTTARAARPAQVAFRLVSALDRFSPRLAARLEGVVLGGAVRQWRQRLRGIVGRRAA